MPYITASLSKDHVGHKCYVILFVYVLTICVFCMYKFTFHVFNWAFDSKNIMVFVTVNESRLIRISTSLLT